MRIRITHETTFRYEAAARWAAQNLRLTPRSFDSQYVLRWRVGVSLDGALRHFEDSLGNVVHAFSTSKPVERIVVTAAGEVETSDAVGVVHGSVETLPAEMFLRASPLAPTNAGMREFAADVIAGAADPLDRLHRLMGAIHAEIACDREVGPSRDAAEAFALKTACGGDIAHIFIAMARRLEIPARYVSGYVVAAPGVEEPGLAAWAEALTPGLGWVAFDAARDLCADHHYVRVAVGFDHASASPFRTAHGGAAETIATSVEAHDLSGQWQSQNLS